MTQPDSPPLKLTFHEIDRFPSSKTELYDSINRIPLQVKLNVESSRSGDTFARADFYSQENFVELKFFRLDGQLVTITVVTASQNAIVIPAGKLPNCDGKPYSAYANFDEKVSEAGNIVKRHFNFESALYRTSNAIQIAGKQKKIARHFMISEQCAIGVDEENCFSSLSLIDLSTRDIVTILGY